MNKENIVAALICCMVVSMMLIGLDGHNLSEEIPVEKKTIVEYYEPPEDITPEETTVEETIRETLYDVPLSAELQQYIMEQSLDHNINPALVFAIIEIESNYDTTAAGDNGRSIGLMQINTHWHQERMDKLGVTDLSNPYQNVDVGIDILSELFAEYEDINFVLMSYNGGVSYAQNLVHNGIYSTDYTDYVTSRCLELQSRR